MDVASFLKKIGDVLSERDTGARELDALEFAADGRDVSIRVRRQPHGGAYPPLPVILASIGRTCLEEGVALPQLSRIKVYRFPIESVLGAPMRELTPAARLRRGGQITSPVASHASGA